MDPEACVLAMESAILDGEYELADDCCESYSEWIKKGGFGVAKWPEISLHYYMLWREKQKQLAD